MSINTKHISYINYNDDWVVMRDSYIGEKAIKAKSFKYLPPTMGMEIDGLTPGQIGLKAYKAYLMRSVYHTYVAEAVDEYIGMMYEKNPIINLPNAMEFMRNNVSMNGETMEMFLSKINKEQLITGRVGIIVDISVDEEGLPRPYLALYNAENIINWDDNNKNYDTNKLIFVVLEEEVNKRVDEFNWETEKVYRVLDLENNEYRHRIFSKDEKLEEEIIPVIRGNKLNVLPFVIINSNDVTSTVSVPPLYKLAEKALTIYRGEADYRQNLFMQGQDTLVLIGALKDEEGLNTRIGAGAVVRLPEGGEARYVGVQSKGLTEQRLALENDRIEAKNLSTKLSANNSNNESGVAVSLKLSVQTASLVQIVKNAGNGLEQALKICAEWMGANPDEVQIQPNIEFFKPKLNAREIIDIINAKNLGAPVSIKTIHNIMTETGITKMTYDEEIDIINTEDPDLDKLYLNEQNKLLDNENN